MGELDGSLTLEGTPQSSILASQDSAASAAAQPNTPVYTNTTRNDTTHSDLATTNRTAVLQNAELPVAESFGPSPSPTLLTNRIHIRAPSAAGLSLQTDIPMNHIPAPKQSPNTPTIVESRPEGQLKAPVTAPKASVTAPIAIQGGTLRTALSTASMTGSLSPGSAYPSPALNALADITPLPSPLVVSGSPGPWTRAALPRPGSRGSSSITRDDSFAILTNGTLSPSPSKKKKEYRGLMPAAVEAAAVSMQTQQKNEAGHSRNRSISEFVPEALHNIRPRHVTISNAGHGEPDIEILSEPNLHREAYLAAQRGLLHTTAANSQSSLPTPPASNRSVTESEEEEEVPEEEDNIEYLAVRQGPQKSKTLWRPVRQLGQGTFSKVFLATSEKLPAKDMLEEATLDPRKLVAIKVVEHGPAGGANEERVELSLKREVEMLRSVSHPSLVHLRAFDYDDVQALLVLTYCPGGDLFELASEHRDLLNANIVQRFFSELVGAIRYLHTELIVHRDIKLENVLLNIPVATLPLLKQPQSHPYPLITLTDLGLSRRIPAPPASPLLTTRCGSEDYAAPEILLGQPYDGRATDAWALGVLLYALMEGRLPFDPPAGKVASRSRAVHRIARCDWVWCQFGDQDGEWDIERGKLWEGARQCVEGLLKKVTRGRKSLEEIEGMRWVKDGITVEGGLKRRIEDDGCEDVEGVETR
ncbi:kinase-like protein [Lepidopterella palustris CBS 459.81]|uniref:Kinase-like protein n=1 Tax=Lepidopterella palustris CBS 459.81 TaxID=1314670 RepID=A0A8E2DZF9_9PEZI|nr:kinase-like protein [Lepidopterella palustris CBS 459.81]